MQSLTTGLIPFACLTLMSSEALASTQDAPEGAGGEVSTDGVELSASQDDEPEDRGPRDPSDKWINRWPPQRNLWELGVYGGVYLPGSRHELFEPRAGLPDQGFQRYSTLGPDFGARVGYYPIRWLGVELEGGVMPLSVDNGERATVFSVRGNLVFQIPRWSVVPFLLVGPAMLGVASAETAVGNDIDPALDLGGGVKINVSRRVHLRIDLRDVISHKQGVDLAFRGHNFEALFGLGLTLGRKAPERKGPIDTDGDGIFDPDDTCPEVPGVPEYEGCPIPDTDGDGILDPDDECVDVPGVVEYEGCPIPDTDGDGILDPDDECVDVPGVPEYEGCPIPDTDGDGILDPDDKCVEEPENVNGFEDADGCPDEIPEEVKMFTGVIEGIFFDTSKATIKERSKVKLDKAVDVLSKFPTVRLEIAGHTDSKGKYDRNLELSRRRAESVKNYLIEHGIDASRLETRGAGPDEPVDDNRTKAGRANNRRIEFRVLQ